MYVQVAFKYTCTTPMVLKARHLHCHITKWLCLLLGLSLSEQAMVRLPLRLGTRRLRQLDTPLIELSSVFWAIPMQCNGSVLLGNSHASHNDKDNQLAYVGICVVKMVF
jgi:hypothetical protein